VVNVLTIYSERGNAQALTLEQVQFVVNKYTNEWNARNPQYPLWVYTTGPGDPISVPGAGANFGRDKGGMEIAIHAEVILLNKSMVPESILTTFTHEYGHAQYRLAHPTNFDTVDSEVAAIRSSLTILPKESFESLAYREAKAIKEMANMEPYKSALQKLANDPLWKKYSSGLR
jgi:hypothetical protein